MPLICAAAWRALNGGDGGGVRGPTLPFCDGGEDDFLVGLESGGGTCRLACGFRGDDCRLDRGFEAKAAFDSVDDSDVKLGCEEDP